MKLGIKNFVVAMSFSAVCLSAAPVNAQSLSDAVGNQPHQFVHSANSSASRPELQPTTIKHHTKSIEQKLNNSKTADSTPKSHSESSTQTFATVNTAKPSGTKTRTVANHKLTPAQILHHQHMLALRAAHRKAAQSAINGFDQVGANKAVDIDSLTRDGASKSAPVDLGAKDLSIGGAIGRAIASLVIVLGLAYGALQVMRKRGIGVASISGSRADVDLSSPELQMHNSGPSTLDQFALAVEKAASRQTIDLSAENGYQKVSKAIDDLELLGSQELPGTAHTLYKVKIGDRILLLGGSLSGALTALTEWDVETKPETDQKFESMLNQMTMSVTPPLIAPKAPVITTQSAGGSQADALRTATQRLSRSARRMAESGRAAANDAP